MTERYLYQELTEKIIGLAMEVHKQLGPGFLEGIYEEAFIYELTKAGLVCEKQKEFTIHYKGIVLAKKLRCDLVVEGKVIVENKSIAEIAPIDEVQLVSYLKASKITDSARRWVVMALRENGQEVIKTVYGRKDASRHVHYKGWQPHVKRERIRPRSNRV